MLINRPRLSCVHEPPEREVVTVADAILAFAVPVVLLVLAMTEACQ